MKPEKAGYLTDDGWVESDGPRHVKTLRDEFAMAAMSGFLANGYGGSSEELANAAYEVAFYMLKAKEQK